MVSKRDLKYFIRIFGLHVLDEEEQIAKNTISETEVTIQWLMDTKQPWGRELIRKSQTTIRRAEADLLRIQNIRDEIASSHHPRRRFGLTPDYYCEYRDCFCTNVEVEEVRGKPLTLCEEHGPEWGDHLTTVLDSDMAEWANEHLKGYSARKWRMTDEQLAQAKKERC